MNALLEDHASRPGFTKDGANVASVFYLPKRIRFSCFPRAYSYKSALHHLRIGSLVDL